MQLKYFENIDLSSVFVVRLKAKEEIRNKLLEIMSEKNIRQAMILSAIGSVYEATFFGVKSNSQLPYNKDQITIIKKTGPFEVLTLEGNILSMNERLIPHLHVTLGTQNGNVIGGHLDRAIVYTTLELFLAEIKGCDLVKNEDEVSGGLQIKLPMGTDKQSCVSSEMNCL